MTATSTPPDSRPAPTWADHLDAYERALTRAQAALASGEWPQDGWTAPSLAVPDDEPTDGELVRYRRLAVLAVEITAGIRASMDQVREELSRGGRQRDAARSYAHASVIEDRARR